MVVWVGVLDTWYNCGMDVETKRKRVAFFDLDKTIYPGHTFFGIVEEVAKNGMIETSLLAQMAEERRKHHAGEQSYSVAANNLLVLFARAMGRRNCEDLMEVTKKFFENNKSAFYPYFEQVLPKLKEKYEVYLVTTNVQAVAQVVVGMFGLAGYLSTEMEMADGKYTGRVVHSLANGKRMVNGLVSKYGRQGSLAVGDSENDIEMLEVVERAICFESTEGLKKIALERGWKIVNRENAAKELLNLVES